MENKKYSLDAVLPRTDRQNRIWGRENQGRLYDAKVVVNGNGLLSEMVLGGLAGLGIGEVFIFDNTKNNVFQRSFLTDSGKLDYRARDLKQTLGRINPYIQIYAYKSIFSESILDYEGFRPDIIVDASNSLQSKEKVLDYLKENPDTSFISGCANHKKSLVSVLDEDKSNVDDLLCNLGEFDRQTQGGLVSSVAGGIMADEIRKKIFQINEKDRPVENRFFYNLDSKSRIGSDCDIHRDIGDITGKKFLVAGAGSIGNYVALNLALSGFKNIDILDCDSVEDSNLNRQILFYDKIGQRKAEVLSERIKQLGKIKSKGFDCKLDKNSGSFFKANKYDLIFGCFDNVRARYLLSEFAVKFGIPYIDGGTNGTKGSAVLYIPEKTPCVKCSKGLKLEEEVKASCGDAAPSVVIPNIVIGGLMVGEAVNYLSGRDLLKSSIGYSTMEKERIFMKSVMSGERGCECKREMKNRESKRKEGIVINKGGGNKKEKARKARSLIEMATRGVKETRKTREIMSEEGKDVGVNGNGKRRKEEDDRKEIGERRENDKNEKVKKENNGKRKEEGEFVRALRILFNYKG